VKGLGRLRGETESGEGQGLEDGCKQVEWTSCGMYGSRRGKEKADGSSGRKAVKKKPGMVKDRTD